MGLLILGPRLMESPSLGHIILQEEGKDSDPKLLLVRGEPSHEVANVAHKETQRPGGVLFTRRHSKSPSHKQGCESLEGPTLRNSHTSGIWND